MARKSILDVTGAVVNVVVVEAGDWQPGSGLTIGPDGGEIGDTLVGGAYVRPAPAPPPLPTMQELIAYASNKRWKVEIGGITFNGIAVPTDDRAKLLILGAAMTLADEASSPMIIGGQYYGLMTGAQFKAINAAVVAHVQATFPVLADVLAAISADPPTIVDYAEIDAAAWPT